MDLELMSKIGTIKCFKEKEFICIENDLGENLYIILKGRVGVYLNSFGDKNLKVATLEEGNLFGEMSLLENLPRSATIIALEEGATVIQIDKIHFYTLIVQDYEVAFRIMQSLSVRIEKAIAQLKEKNPEKAKAYLQEYCKEPMCVLEEKDFYKMIEKDIDQAFNKIKDMSRKIRILNEEILESVVQK